MRVLALVLISILAGCVFLRTPLSDSEAKLRVRRALRDLDASGFTMPPDLGLDWSDREVRCAPGNVCASPRLRPDGGGRLVLAPQALESDARFRLALLEVWQRFSDGGSMRGPWAFARSTLRQLVSGPRVGVSDPVILSNVLEAYAEYRGKLKEDQRVGLPDPRHYSRAMGIFLVPITLVEPSGEPGLADDLCLSSRALGAFSVGDCKEAHGYIHIDLPCGPGRLAYWRGVCYGESGDRERAAEELLRAERLLPHERRVPIELGDVLCRMGHTEAGIQAFERAESKGPAESQRAEALRGIARCQLEAGQIDEARRAYHEVLKLDPDDAVTEDWLRWLEQGDVLEKLTD